MRTSTARKLQPAHCSVGEYINFARMRSKPKISFFRWCSFGKTTFLENFKIYFWDHLVQQEDYPTVQGAVHHRVWKIPWGNCARINTSEPWGAMLMFGDVRWLNWLGKTTECTSIWAVLATANASPAKYRWWVDHVTKAAESNLAFQERHQTVRKVFTPLARVIVFQYIVRATILENTFREISIFKYLIWDKTLHLESMFLKMQTSWSRLKTGENGSQRKFKIRKIARGAPLRTASARSDFWCWINRTKWLFELFYYNFAGNAPKKTLFSVGNVQNRYFWTVSSFQSNFFWDPSERCIPIFRRKHAHHGRRRRNRDGVPNVFEARKQVRSFICADEKLTRLCFCRSQVVSASSGVRKPRGKIGGQKLIFWKIV